MKVGEARRSKEHITHEKSEEKGKERKKEGNREGRGKDLDKCTLEFCLGTFSFFLPRVKRGCKCLFLFIPT